MPTKPVKPPCPDWTGLTEDPYFPAAQVAPPALAVDLAALDYYAMAGTCAPYVCCTQFTNGSATQRMLWRVAPGTRCLRPVVTRSSAGASKGTLAGTTWRETSGSPGFDSVTLPPFANGVDAYPPSDIVQAAIGGEVYDAAPAAAEDRVLLVTSALTPSSERVTAQNGCAFGAIPVQVADLSTL